MIAKDNIDIERSSEGFAEGLVSVIMPMHNSANYLREAIESVLQQTYPNWELLIIDDVSTDDSVKIAREYESQDQRIHVLINTEHTGIPSAPRNVGLKVAKGRYIAFLDSDDVYFPQKLEEELPLFQHNPDTVVVYANYEKMSESGDRNNRIIKAPLCTTHSELLKGNVITMPAGIYDRQKAGTVFLRDVRHEDYVMWLDILRKGGVARSTGTVVAIVRVRSYSVSSNKLKTLTWQWKVYRQVEGLSLPSSVYYFAFYAYKAFLKSLI